ncbi:serine/threonine protein kinase [Bryobacter aggregatus]|uniref:serine/threonine protein kinase n=1 Tax=Bryobacter aggregatus TaxID=360054 RepID=UPI00068ECA88|nr:serine/threonine-protein kinase [Bryobacter aggregatus]
MSDARWIRVQSAFLEAAELAPDARSAFLDTFCEGDTELRADIESLLASDNWSTDAIADAVHDEAALLLDDRNLTGQRLGPYRVLHEIGRGGMGTVYLAVRDDDQFQKQVAVKVVKRGMDTAEVLARFRHERQILANLEHPYIARLLDAGTTPDARPFFILEYVDGKNIDVYCREQKLSPAACCRLFLRVCEAVSYAHRNLVVHRDLKPGNILVNADHTPKLLDFGVAKLLSNEGDGSTTALPHRPFTPDYASPELVRGLPVTTAADVYALGAVLFEMLTGRRAQSITSSTPSEVERAVCEIEVTRPSSISSGLNADLDNIVLMAMRKNPARRYSSVDLLAEDIQRYLDGKPIAARQDSYLYRSAKFLRRNWLEVGAATAVILSLVVGLAISVDQSRRANAATQAALAERQIALQERSRAEHQSKEAMAAREAEATQRGIADQQRLRAELRATDLLQLSNHSLFEIHDSIKVLPGAIAARRAIVKSTLDYLARLEKESTADPRLRLTLSAAYYRLANIQGDIFGPSINDFAGARESLLHAESLLRPLYEKAPSDPQLLQRWIEIESALAENTNHIGNRGVAEASYLKLLPLTHRLAQISPDDRIAKTHEAHIESRLVYVVNPDQFAAAQHHATRMVQLYSELVRRFPNQLELKQHYGGGLATFGNHAMRTGNLEVAADAYRQAIEIRETLLAADPNNAVSKRSLLVNYGNYATVLGLAWMPNLGRYADSRAYSQKAVTLARELVQSDAQDTNARYDLAMCLSRLGMVQPDPGGESSSLASLSEAIALIEPIYAANPKSTPVAAQLSMAREYAGHRLRALGRIDEAIRQYQQAIADAEGAMSGGSGSLTVQAFVTEEALADLYATRKDSTTALDFSRRAIARAEAFFRSDPNSEPRAAHLARAYAELSAIHRSFGQHGEAREAAQHALTLWAPVRNAAAMFSHRKIAQETRDYLNTTTAQSPR